MALPLLPATDMYKRPEGLEPSPVARMGVGTGAVMGAGIGEGFTGATSLAANINAYLVERDTGRQQNMLSWGLGAAVFNTGNFVETLFGGGETEEDRMPLSKEEWQESEFYREGLEYKPGLTVRSARILQQTRDTEERNAYIMEQASGWQKGGFFVSAIAGSLADAKNWAVGGASAGVVRGGYAAFSGVRAVSQSRAVGLATKAVVARQAATGGFTGYKTTKKGLVAEAALGAGIAGGLGFEAERVLGREYGVGDVVLDFLVGGIISVSIKSLGDAAGRMYLKHASADDINALHGVMNAQTTNGEVTNVTPLMQAQLAERYIPFSTLSPDSRVPEVSRIGRKKQYTAKYKGEAGMYSGVTGRGKTPEEAIADLESIYRSGEVGDQKFNTVYDEDYFKDALSVQEMKDRLALFDIDAERDRAFLNIYGESLDAAESRISTLEEKLVAAGETQKKGQISKAKKELDAEEKKFEEAVAAANADVDSRYSAIKEQHRAARDALVEKQKQLTAPLLERWTRQQLSPDPRSKVAGVDNENANTQAYVDEANQAANGDPAEAAAKDAGEIAALESMAQSESVPAEFRELIKGQMETMAVAKKLPEAYRNYMACVAKG